MAAIMSHENPQNGIIYQKIIPKFKCYPIKAQKISLHLAHE